MWRLVLGSLMICSSLAFQCGLAAADDKAEKPAGDKKADPVSFSKDIAPILLKNCQACHGQKDAKSNYRLHTYQQMLKPGDFELPTVTAGKLDESELYRIVAEETDPDSWMPKEGDRLPAEEIALIKRWIEEGAKYDAKDKEAPLASIVPTAKHADPPEAYRVPLPVTAVAFSPDGKELAVGGYHEITVWDPAAGNLLRRIKNVAERTYRLAYSPDGKYLAAASGDPGRLGEVRLFDAASGKLARVLGTMSDAAFAVAFSPDGQRLAASSADRSIRVYDVESASQLVLIEDHADWVMSVAWSHDGNLLVSASRDKTSKVFDANTGQSQITYSGHGNTVYDASFSPDNKQVLSGGADKQIHVWNVSDAKKTANIGGFGNEVYVSQVIGDQLYCASADKTAKQFNVNDRKLIRNYAGHTDWVYTLAVNPEAKRLATGTYDGEVRIWNTEDGAEVVKFFAAPGYEAKTE